MERERVTRSIVLYRLRTSFRVVSICVLAVFALGWDCQIPQDPEKTLQRARDGLLRVGLAEAEPWAYMDERGQVGGVEVELLQQFASQINAEIQWVTGPQNDLLEKLHKFELDVVVGGLTKNTPWKQKVGLTQPFALVPDSTDPSKKIGHVIAVAPGENRLVKELDTFLEGRREDIRRVFPEETS